MPFETFLYSRPREVILCHALRPSICLSVNFLCPLHNSDTLRDIFMKLGTSINHHQMICREQESTIHLHFLWNYGSLKFFYENCVRSITLIPCGIFS